MNLWDVAVLELDSHPEHNKLLTSLAMTWFGLSIEAEYRASGTSSKVPLPSIEPITFQCRADTLRVMPRTRVRSLINNIYIKSGRARGVDGVLT